MEVKGSADLECLDEKERLCSKLSCTEIGFSGHTIKEVSRAYLFASFLILEMLYSESRIKWTTQRRSGWPPVLSSGFFPFWDHSPFSQPSIGRTPLSHTQRRFQAVVYSRLNINDWRKRALNYFNYFRRRITFFHGINYLNTLPPVATFTDLTAAF